jgi:peptidoglycan/LPS O-acetylase OafA/YrhL
VTAPVTPLPIAGKHVPVLDGLRGVAVLVVLLHHFTPNELTVPFWDWSVARWMHIGWGGVDLFFVLSGFLITGILLDTKASSHYLRNFYARRTLRIFPLYYGFLIAVFVLAPLALSIWHLQPRLMNTLGETYYDNYQSLVSNQAWLWTYCMNISYVFGYKDWFFVGHFWSLAVEEHFYLIWPILVLLLSRRALLAASVGCIAGALVLRVVMVCFVNDRWTVYLLTPCRMDGLALGAVLSLLVRDGRGLAWVSRHAAGAALVCTAVLAAGFIWQNSPHQGTYFTETIGHTLLVVLSGAVLIIALTAPATGLLNRLLTSSPLLFFGKYSYGLYVLHRPIIYPLKKMVPVERLAEFFGSALLGNLCFQAMNLILSIVLALACWHLFESPFLKLKRYFN